MSLRTCLTVAAVQFYIDRGLAVHLNAGVGASIRQQAAVEPSTEIPLLIATNMKTETEAARLARADAEADSLERVTTERSSKTLGSSTVPHDRGMPPPAVVASTPADAIASYVFDGDFICIQGPFRHTVYMLSLLKSSVVGGLHASNTVELQSCEDRGFPHLHTSPHDGSEEDHCYPPARLFWRDDWNDDPEFGRNPWGGLFGAQAAEVDVVNALHARATAWPAEMWEDATKCDCLEGSEVDQLMPDLDTESCWEESQAFVSSFVTDDGLECVEGPLLYVEHALATVRSSALAALYSDTRIEGMTCASRGFGDGISEADACYQRATRFYRSDSDRSERRAAEDAALTVYIQEHSATLQGHSHAAIRHCSCTAGSELYEGLSAEDLAACDDAALRSPVLDFWRPGYQ